MENKCNKSLYQIFSEIRKSNNIFDIFLSQENIDVNIETKNEICETLSKSIENDNINDQFEIEIIDDFYDSLYNLYEKKDQIVSSPGFSFNLFDLNYLEELKAILSLNISLITSLNVSSEKLIFINALKVFYFIFKNMKSSINKFFKNPEKLDFTICFILVMGFFIKKNMEIIDFKLICASKLDPLNKIISQITFLICHYILFENIQSDFILSSCKELEKYQDYHLILNIYKEESYHSCLIAEKIYVSRLCLDIDFEKESEISNINYCQNMIERFIKRNENHENSFSFLFFLNFRRNNQSYNFQFFNKLFYNCVEQFHDKGCEYVNHFEIYQKESIGINQSSIENSEIEFHKNHFIFRFGSNQSCSATHFQIFLDNLSSIMKINFKSTPKFLLNGNEIQRPKFNFFLNFDHFFLLSFMNIQYRLIIVKIYIKEIVNQELILNNLNIQETNGFKILLEIHFIECEFNSNLLEFLRQLISDSKSSRNLTVLMNFGRDNFLVKTFEFFNQLYSIFDKSKINHYPSLIFRTDYAKIILNFPKSHFSLFNTRKKVDSYQIFIKIFDLYSNIDFETFTTDFKQTGVSFLPDSYIIKLLKKYKNYILYDYKLNSKEIQKYYQLLDSNNVNFKLKQYLLNMNRIYQIKLKSHEVIYFENNYFNLSLVLQKLKSDNLIIHSFVEKDLSESNIQNLFSFYSEIYDRKSNWTIYIYHKENMVKEKFYENNGFLIFKQKHDKYENIIEKFHNKHLYNQVTQWGEFSNDEKSKYLYLFCVKKYGLYRLSKEPILDKIHKFIAFKSLKVKNYILLPVKL